MPELGATVHCHHGLESNMKHILVLLTCHGTILGQEVQVTLRPFSE